MASKLFGGVNLSDVARNVNERPAPATPERPGNPRVVLPAAELALTGRAAPELERENIFSVDPKRVKPWKHHNRLDTWYTRERCQDLIESIAKDEQQEPALARRLKGDPTFDFELIYGMRRRFACETLGKKLKLRVVDADDGKAAVLMHIENADRQDITPMERALSFQALLDGKVFATQEDLSEAMNLSKGQVSKLLKAAGLLRVGSIGNLFADRSGIPVDQAYKLASLLERTGAKDVILQAAKNLAKEGEGRGAADVLKVLIASLDRTKKFQPVQKQYNVGTSRRVAVTRNAKGKVTFAFAQGLQGLDKAEVLKAVEEILKDLG
jgi:ParB family transcriptional regulator, chromosome partitioning protein